MAVFARVVVGVDGTALGFEALRQVLTLVPADAAVHSVTAVDARAATRVGFGGAAHWTQILEEQAEATRETAAAILGDRAGSTARVLAGEPVHALRRARDEANATLVALGGRHSSRFLGIMLGDTGTELLHDGACSVLVARPHDGDWQPRSVVVGLDGSPSGFAALATADELVGRLGSAVEVVHATAGGPLPEEAWAERVDAWEEPHPVPALIDRSKRADLVVVGSRGLHGVRALGSVSERVAHRAQCSVLVVHAGTEGD